MRSCSSGVGAAGAGIAQRREHAVPDTGELGGYLAVASLEEAGYEPVSAES